MRKEAGSDSGPGGGEAVNRKTLKTLLSIFSVILVLALILLRSPRESEPGVLVEEGLYHRLYADGELYTLRIRDREGNTLREDGPMTKRPVVTEEKKKIEEVIFFEIRQSDTKAAQGTEKAIKDVADLMKTSDDAVFTLTGYADKGTGNPKLNQMYAKRRADDVTKILIEEHGLDASRLTSDSKGDTVQPFEENDKNRCVIITGEGTFKVTKYEEYDTQKITTKKVKNTVIREVVDEVYDD
jgi:outer membrane protein OmpA-like peptidoglycan-associated protein